MYFHISLWPVTIEPFLVKFYTRVKKGKKISEVGIIIQQNLIQLKFFINKIDCKSLFKDPLKKNCRPFNCQNITTKQYTEIVF